MYIYFQQFQSVLTCEEHPQIIPVKTMEKQNMENMCNKWEKPLRKMEHLHCRDFEYNCGTMRGNKLKLKVIQIRING